MVPHLENSATPKLADTGSRNVYIPLYSLVETPAEKSTPKSDAHGRSISLQSAGRNAVASDSRLPGETEYMVSLSPEVFGHPIRRDIVHLCLIHYMDGRRQGSANTKTRYEVRGSRRKLFAQKGMGKARVGDAASPIRRGGGVAFGPRPRDFSTRLPRKVRFMGMRVAWSAKVREGRLMAVESLAWAGLKTRTLAQRLDKMGWSASRTLFVTGGAELPEGFRRSCSNLEGMDAKLAPEVNIHDALKYPRVVMDLSALEYYEERLRKGSTMPVPDTRRKMALSRREERKAIATKKATILAQQLVELQYQRRFGQTLPPISRRLTKVLEQ